MTQATSIRVKPRPARRDARTRRGTPPLEIVREHGKKASSVFAERRRLLASARLTPATRDIALALCTFDEWTDPDELASARKGMPAVGIAIRAFTHFLRQRTKERAAWALQGREFAPPADSAAVRQRAEDAETAFRDALVRAFRPVAGAHVFPVRKFEQAFAAFVGGEIRLGKLVDVEDDALANHGVPDGASYFCFAEAILMFLRLGLHPEFWRPLLRTFVCGARFFTASYWQRGKRAWASYGDRPRPEVPTAVILASLDHEFAALTPSQLARRFTDIAGVALRDEANLPRPDLLAEELV